MFAAQFHEFGGPEVIRLEEVVRPTPGPGEALVEVRAAALNHLDLWVRRGLPIETTMPHIGGSDVAGVIVELGHGVDHPSLDSRVVANPTLHCGRCSYCAKKEESLCQYLRILGEHTQGGFAEYVVVPAANLEAIPDYVSFETAAALPVAYQTAWRAVFGRAGLRPGEEVLVLGASGGTGVAAVQISLLAGARVSAVTSGPVNVHRLLELGVDRVYDRTEVDFSRQFYFDTGKRGADVVIDGVGSAAWDGAVRALAPGGRLVSFGATTGPQVSLDIRRIFWKQLQIIGTTMASVREFRDMLRAAWSRQFTPIIDSVLPLTELRQAHERLEKGDQFGKIILIP